VQRFRPDDEGVRNLSRCVRRHPLAQLCQQGYAPSAAAALNLRTT
jgi:hypothetical protein